MRWSLGAPGVEVTRPGSIEMKILLQHIRTELFLRSLGNWTANYHEAHDFQHSQRAIDFAREHGLSGVQLAVKFVESQFDEVFPIPQSTGNTVHLTKPS